MLPNCKLKLVLEARLSHYHGGHIVVHILLAVVVRVGTDASIAAHDQIPLDGLDHGQGIDLDGAALPLTQVAALRMTLQVALENRKFN